MSLTPQDIVRKEFREALRGYNQADVDLFLDEVVEEFGRLTDEHQKLKVRLAALQQEVARFREGRGAPGEPAVVQQSPADAHRVESEVRLRVRRFLEEQLRLLDTGAPAPAASPTVERIAREVAPLDHEPPRARRDDAREPFWAGE